MRQESVPPQQESVPADGARAADVAERWYPFWNAYFGLALVGTVSVVGLQTNVHAGRGVSVALLLILTIAYVTFGRFGLRATGTPNRMAWLYVAVMVACFVPATLIVPAAAFGLAALIPQLYLTVQQRYAALLTAVLLSGVGIRWIGNAITDPLVGVLILAVLVGCAGGIGALIGWMGDQNVERARLIAELDRTRDELAEANRQAGVLAERERIAGDIHDTVGQDLGAISMLIQAAEAETGPSEHLQAARESAKNSLAEVRALVAAMAPPALAEMDLVTALEDLAGSGNPPAAVRVQGRCRPLPADTEAALLRVGQEALVNIGKHARADEATVRLDYQPTRVMLAIVDDGIGFTVRAETPGYGLRGMHARVVRLEGVLTIDSEPGVGTKIIAVLPC